MKCKVIFRQVLRPAYETPDDCPRGVDVITGLLPTGAPGYFVWCSLENGDWIPVGIYCRRESALARAVNCAAYALSSGKLPDEIRGLAIDYSSPEYIVPPGTLKREEYE